MNKSAVAEAKGQMKKSLEIAIDAYMALAHDATPNELQARMIRKTEARIVALSGKVPVVG